MTQIIILKDKRQFETKDFYVVKKHKIGDVGIVRKNYEDISCIMERK